MISYAPLWKTLKKKDITQYRLIKDHNVSTGTLDTLRKDKSVTANTLNDLCIILDCEIQDIIEIIPTREEKAKFTKKQ